MRLTDANGQSTTAVYDGLGRRLSSLDPNQGARSYTYNGEGALTSATDARGWVKTFTYDALGRVVRRNWSEQSVAQNSNGATQVDDGVDVFTYDQYTNPQGISSIAAGQLLYQKRTLTHRPSGVLLEAAADEFRLDALYRVRQSKKVIQSGTRVEDFISTAYFDSNFGRIKQSTLPGGVAVAYRYNAQGFALGEALLNQAADPNQYLRRVNSEDAYGNATDVSLNGVGAGSSTMKRLLRVYDVSCGKPM